MGGSVDQIASESFNFERFTLSLRMGGFRNPNATSPNPTTQNLGSNDENRGGEEGVGGRGEENV